MTSARTLLRYFDCRGRGQPLRYALAELLPEYTDERVPLDGFPGTWFEMRKDREKAGPFACLPILVHEDLELAQTQVIADFLSRKFDQYPADEAGRTRLQMATAAAYSDLIEPYAQLLWQAPADDVERLRQRMGYFLGQVQARHGQLEVLLAQRPGIYFGGQSPAIADYFVYEALCMGELVLGPHVGDLLAQLPRLAQLVAQMHARPAVRKELDRAPLAITGSPKEQAIRQAIAALDH